MADEVSWSGECFWRQPVRFPPGFQGRCSHSQTVVGDQLIIIGGGRVAADSTTFTHFNDVLLFNLATRQYSVVESSPQQFRPRRNHSAVVKGEDILVFGGAATPDEEDDADQEMELLDDLWAFNTRTLSWWRPPCHSAPPLARRGHVATMYGDRMIVLGGLTPFVDPRIHILDTNTWEWRTTVGAGIFPELHNLLASCRVDDRLFVYGVGGSVTPTMLCLDLRVMEWHQLPIRGHMEQMRFCPAAALLQGRYFMLFGGSNVAGRAESLNSVVALDLADPWNVKCRTLLPRGQLPAKRNASAMTFVGNVAIITGGGEYPEKYHNDILLLDFRPPIHIARSPQPMREAPILEYFATLCQDQTFSDVTLVVNEQRIPGHKIVLAARAQYFRSLFHGRFSEGAQQANEVMLQEMKIEPFLHVLRYLYCGQPEEEMFASQDCLLGVIDCAQMLGVDGLVESITHRLVALAADVTDWAQLLPFLQIAETYQLNQLYWPCMRHLHHVYHFAMLQRPGDTTAHSQSSNEQAFAVLSDLTKQRVEHAQTQLLCVPMLASDDSLPIRVGV